MTRLMLSNLKPGNVFYAPNGYICIYSESKTILGNMSYIFVEVADNYDNPIFKELVSVVDMTVDLISESVAEYGQQKYDDGYIDGTLIIF